MDEQQQHEHDQPLRVQYLAGEKPQALVGHEQFAVTEISQFEMVIDAGCRTFRLFETFTATVRFPDTARVAVDGYVLRAGDDRVIIQLIRGFSASRLLLERQQIGQQLILAREPRDRRRHPRLRYPDHERPLALIDNGRYPVVEIAEGGIVFQCTTHAFGIDQSVFAVIRFLDNAYIAVQGTVLRITGDRVVVRLNRGLSAQRVELETRQFGSQAMTGAAPDKERRRHVRVQYPQDAAPQLLIQGRRYPVMEISTSSVVIRTRDMRFRLRQPVAAVLKYDDSTKMITSGIVYRMTTDRVVIRLQVGLPESWVLSEQQRLSTPRPAPLPPPSTPAFLMGIDLHTLRH